MFISNNAGKIDDLVQYISLYKTKPIILNLNILPFIFLYILAFYLRFFIFIDDYYYEFFNISIIVIASIQVLVSLCCFWSVHVHTFLNCRKMKLPVNATLVKVVPTKNNGSAELVTLYRTNLDSTTSISTSTLSEQTYWFLFQKIKYIWNDDKAQFYAIEFPINNTYGKYSNWKGYQTEHEITTIERTYGNNQMTMVVPEFLELFKERATAPFFVFQLFSVGLWLLDEYWYYSLFTLCMLIVFECTLVQQQLRNMSEIRKMGNKPYQINVYRFNKWRLIQSDQLLPGDLISICRSQDEIFVPCDVILLRGSCIVDESMLTGESVPQIKESLENSDDLNRQLDIENDGKLFCLYGGTKVVQHTAPIKTTIGNNIRAPDDGCIAYVLRNGFNTSQGKLLRTILFGVKRVTENNAETFAFILFLLIFAIAAASYVWIKGVENVERSRYKLFLECTLILTSIIPPDLPIELSLAVNTSLLQLSKLIIYCTEPFRIPMAGKVQICCFDKTGTLTSDDLLVEGIAGLTDNHLDILKTTDCTEQTIQVLATCHSLAQLDDGLVGDPLEKATLIDVDWNLTKQDTVIPKHGKFKPLKIYHRFYFSSALKRMSVIAGYLIQFSNDVHYIGTVKGAPEVIMKMLKKVPDNYQKTYLEYSRRGARVLALAQKDIGKCDSQTIREMKREDVEKDLNFVGFIIISCPLKSDSKSIIKEIVKASHKVVMITGDNPLTACYVAKELRFTRKTVLVLTPKIVNIPQKPIEDVNEMVENDQEWYWQSINEDINKETDIKMFKNLLSEYDICITGEGLKYLNEYKHDYLLKIIPYISVYARFAPKQKEFVITTLKALGYFTLMCGDGTNDVGALKHADVGVSILSNAPIKRKQKTVTNDSNNTMSTVPISNTNVSGRIKKMINDGQQNLTARERAIARHRENVVTSQDMLKKALKDIENDQVQIVKLGDASIAAPFTSKQSSIMCVCHIIKQGRCTLVTTLQMFKILALNALISAYCQSVLYVGGVKFSDAQATLQGLFIAACFLFITRSKPLKVLSKEAPLPNIFNFYTLMTILLQFAVHFTALVYLLQEATARSPPSDEKIVLNIDLVPGEKVEFKPNIINSTVYIICLALQVSTFAVNHKGHPFMESLRENKLLMYSILTSSAVVICLALDISSELTSMFEIVEFPSDFKNILIGVLLADTILAYCVDRLCSLIFGSSRKKSDVLNC